MLRLVWLLIALVLCFAGIAAGTSSPADLSGNLPNSSTPQKLQEAWLNFHESDLCQEVDALFVFNKSGMEVWSRIESDKILQKFQELFEPLKNSYAVELYTTRPPTIKRQDSEDDPPPSLWQNYELRYNLGDHAASTIRHLFFEEQVQLDPFLSDPSLKQRLLIYAERTLNWNRRMERYALDLAALARVAYDPGVSPDLKSRAMAVCAAHAQNLEKYIGKLAANLTQALPISEKQKRASTRPEAPVNANKAPAEKADQISAVAQGVSRRVYRFIYPEHYTVELEELRHPTLLESLGALRGMVSDFQKSLAKPARK